MLFRYFQCLVSPYLPYRASTEIVNFQLSELEANINGFDFNVGEVDQEIEDAMANDGGLKLLCHPLHVIHDAA